MIKYQIKETSIRSVLPFDFIVAIIIAKSYRKVGCFFSISGV